MGWVRRRIRRAEGRWAGTRGWEGGEECMPVTAEMIPTLAHCPINR